MPRYFDIVSIDELRAKIKKIGGLSELIDHVGKDIKVAFDLENWTDGDDFGPEKINGYHQLDNGLTYCGFTAGGDWEFPVFLIFYISQGKLRGYVPTDGNPWNTTTKSAYGNDAIDDTKNAIKRWPEIYGKYKGKHLNESKGPFGELEDETDEKKYVYAEDFDYDIPLILQDIKERILLAGTTKPAVTIYSELEDRIKALTFYCTGDEAYEFFRATCHYCYCCWAVGDLTIAEVVYQSAKKQAEDSYSWAVENDRLEEEDTASGHWG